MLKFLTPLCASLIISASFASPAPAAPSTNTADNLAACRQINQGDPNVSVGQCLGFLQTFYTSHDHGWVPHYCKSLQYYEPEAFDAQYDSIADCITTNQGNPPF